VDHPRLHKRLDVGQIESLVHSRSPFPPERDV
jgi:hypothetical protein